MDRKQHISETLRKIFEQMLKEERARGILPAEQALLDRMR